MVRHGHSVWASQGIEGLQKFDVWPEIGAVFDATWAGAHKAHSDVVTGAGRVMIDLTPAAIDHYVIPVVEGAIISMRPMSIW